MEKILIIDDDKMLCDTLSRRVRYMGYTATYALTLEEGLNEALSKAFDVIFLDVRLPDGNGLDAIADMRQTASSPEVIIVTGEGDPDGAELAISTGAWDYIEKPSSIEKMTLPMQRALQYRKEIAQRKPKIALNRQCIVGDSARMKACFDLLAQAANSNANVLITGETGTGKELFAEAIHKNSPRANKSLVVVDCAALPETLLESVLFGHEKGAFTGADKTQDGLIKQADGGTLFLDEVGELSLPIQKVFLRVLQEHKFRPVGGKDEVTCDFRLVAATNRDLDKMVQCGQFRNDLLFRLRMLTIKLPTLRERPEDIKDLSLYYLTKSCERRQLGTKGFSPDFFDTLTAYNWPGNVRELFHTLEAALTSARLDQTLFARHLPNQIRIQAARLAVGKKTLAKGNKETGRGAARELPLLRVFRKAAAAEAEKRYLQDLMSITSTSIKKSCLISGLSRSRLYELLKKHRITLANLEPNDPLL